jgi:hypothetical protein
MQPWEYRTIHRSRDLNDGATGDWDDDVESKLPELGAEGWELVAIVPRSSAGRPVHAGVTSDELWVFKRPSAILSSEAMVVVAQADEPRGTDGETPPADAVAFDHGDRSSAA